LTSERGNAPPTSDLSAKFHTWSISGVWQFLCLQQFIQSFIHWYYILYLLVFT